MRIAASSLVTLGFALLGAVVDVERADAQSACESAKVKSTGKLFTCLMTVEANAIKKGEVASPTKLAKCNTKFDSTCAKGELRGDCYVASYSCPRIREQIDRDYKFHSLKGCTHAPSGLVAWWPFDETQGSAATDITEFAYVWPANPFDVLPSLGSLAFHQNGGPVIGKFGAGYEGYVLAGTSKPHDPSAVTIDAWIKPDSGGGGSIVRYDDGNTYEYHFEAIVPELYFTSRCGGGYYEAGTNGATIPTDVWTHVAFSVDASGPQAYIDGVPQPTFIFNGSYNLPACLQNGSWNITQSFDGAVDEIEIFERVLAPSEVEAIATAPNGKCKPPCF